MSTVQTSRVSARLLIFAIVSCLAVFARGQTVWESDFVTALAKAKKEQRPLCLVYAPANIKPPTSFNDPLVKEATKEFLFVQVYEEQKPQIQKFTQRRGGYPSYFFIDSATEKVVVADGGFGISVARVMKCIIKTRAEVGLPLTPAMQKSLAVAFKPDARLLGEMAVAGDLDGIVAYLKPIENDEFREMDYFVARVNFPATVSPVEIACAVAHSDPVVRASGIVVQSVSRDEKSIVVKVSAPGCAVVNDDLRMVPGGVLRREYQLVPLPQGMAATLTGRVTLAGDKPVANAIVRVCDAGVVVRTDAAGRFTAGGIPPGTFVVRGEAPGGELQLSMTFVAGKTLAHDFALLPAATVGIRWALQTKEKSLSLMGEGVRTGEAYFSPKYGRFLLERGAQTRESWGSDFMLKPYAPELQKYFSPMAKSQGRNPQPGEVVFWLFDGTSWRNGLHQEQAKFGEIAAVNGGQPFDERTYFEFVRGLPPRVGDVFTVRCTRRDCFAKIEVIDVSPAKP